MTTHTKSCQLQFHVSKLVIGNAWGGWIVREKGIVWGVAELQCMYSIKMHPPECIAECKEQMPKIQGWL